MLIFVLLFTGVLLGLVALTVLLILVTLNTTGDSEAVALVDGVAVHDFALLPDNDAYPAAVTIHPDGTVFTGSYVSGALWAIAPDGTITELPAARESIGAVAGLDAAPDGTLYIVDQQDADPRVMGGALWILEPHGTLRQLPGIADERGFVLPDDVAVDANGAVYVTDRGRGEVWRFAGGGTDATLWWTPPPATGDTRPAPTGLAYDRSTDALIITDSNTDTIYRVAIRDGTTEILYAHGDRPNSPGFDGVTVSPDGVLYVAALGQQGIARVGAETLDYIAGLFRGPSDLAYGSERLYVTNFDSFSLVVSAVGPRLPFTLSVVNLNGE